MNHKALINGQLYTFLETLPFLDKDVVLILRTNERGEKYVGSEQLWCQSALRPEQTAPIHTRSSAQEKIKFFLSVFKGREDLYARRYHSVKTGKSGYTPVCKNEWEPGLCDKKKHGCPDCPNRKFLPLTAETVKAHLIGQIGSGKNTRSGIVDIAIMQSLFEGEEKIVKSFVSEYGMVIVDECHHVAAFTFESILKSVEAKYVYGLSATPVRKDGHYPKLAALQAVPPDEAVAVIATGKYIGEGFDSPRLGTLLLAMPISWQGTLAQYAGRLHRNYEGKREVRIYDYVDVYVPMRREASSSSVRIFIKAE